MRSKSKPTIATARPENCIFRQFEMHMPSLVTALLFLSRANNEPTVKALGQCVGTALLDAAQCSEALPQTETKLSQRDAWYLDVGQMKRRQPCDSAQL